MSNGASTPLHVPGVRGRGQDHADARGVHERHFVEVELTAAAARGSTR
jgi:hypothetical protein